MKEIRIVISKGGKTKILAKGPAGAGTEQFTEKLAKNLGEVEERHKAHGYIQGEQQQDLKQGT